MKRRYERFEVTSVDGMVAVVVQLISHGYRYFIEGEVPEKFRGNPEPHDRAIIERYSADASKWDRYYRKKKGLANFRYLRFENCWVLFATEGQRAEFTKRNRGRIVDVTRGAFRFHGYSIGYRPGGYERIPGELRDTRNAGWAEYRERKAAGLSAVKPPAAKRDHRFRASVRIEQEEFEKLHAYFTQMAAHRQAGAIVGELWALPYEPYAPVREQVKKILRDVNTRRKLAGYARIPYTALRWKRRNQRAFDNVLRKP